MELATGGLSQVLEAGVSRCASAAHSIPTWIEVARFALVQVPSSAMAERVFSILTRLFGDNQSSTLEDMLELGVRTEMADTELSLIHI